MTWEGEGASGANDRESVDIGSVQILASEPLNTEKQISLTPAQIEEMVNGTFTNHGFIIVADTELNDRFNYKSSPQHPWMPIMVAWPFGSMTFYN